MKIRNIFYIVTTLCLILVSFNSQASHFQPYWTIFGEYNTSILKNETYNLAEIYGKGKDTEYGGGFGLGIRGDISKFNIGPIPVNGIYIASEVFFTTNKLFDKTADPILPNGVESQELNSYSLLNARLNLGYTFNYLEDTNIFVGFAKNLTFFASLGLKQVAYESTYSYTDYINSNNNEYRKYNDSLIVPMFGLGLNYSISKKLELVLSYDYIKVKVHDAIFTDPLDEGMVKIRVKSLKFGLNYMF